jgi:hypothetical protein
MTIDGVQYDRHKVKSVILDLESCKIILKVIFIKGKNDVVKVMDYSFETNCDVNINEYIKRLDKIINE